MARKLTRRQCDFIRHFLQCLNASEAARRAGYSVHTARQIGYENMHKPKIAKVIKTAFDQRLAEIRARA